MVLINERPMEIGDGPCVLKGDIGCDFMPIIFSPKQTVKISFDAFDCALIVNTALSSRFHGFRRQFTKMTTVVFGELAHVRKAIIAGDIRYAGSTRVTA